MLGGNLRSLLKATNLAPGLSWVNKPATNVLDRSRFLVWIGACAHDLIIVVKEYYVRIFREEVSVLRVCYIALLKVNASTMRHLEKQS